MSSKKKSDGGVLMVEDLGNNCPMCNSPPTCSDKDKENAAAVEKFARKGITW